MIGLGIGITAQQRRGVSAILRAIDRIFPDYLDGDVLVCAVPSFPEWHLAIGAHQGDLLDCAWPTPGSDGTGAYSPLDCTTEIPA